jgi:acyl-CoA synthetase (AMP-forming)/AMP-acid ligase II
MKRFTVADEEIALGSIHWASELAVLAQRYGERIAVIDAAGRHSYADVLAKSTGVARALLAAGIGPADSVATFFRNSADAVAASFGVMQTGATEVPLNPALSADDQAHAIKTACARLVVTNEASAGRLGSGLARTLFVDAIEKATIDLAGFPRVECNAPSRIVFTSGTTGLPKGAVHSQLGRWTANLLLRANLPFRPGARSRVLLMTPFSHGSSLMTHAYLSSGATVLLFDGVDLPTVLGILERGECDAMFAPPTVLAKIVSAVGDRRLASLQTIFCGTAPLKPALYQRAKAVFGPIIRLTYGKSEIFNPITVLEANETDEWYAGGGSDADACVGWPADGVEIDIRRDDGTTAAPREHGEVMIRARHLMTGYRTATGFSPLPSGAFHDTGDLGYFDTRGRLHLTGRIADVIKTGGYKVSPDEVERALAPALGSSEVAVVGIPSDYWGEIILAAAERPAPDWEDRIRPLIETMTGYKRPRLLLALDELPRNGIGKVLRKDIREHVLARYQITDGPRPRLEPRTT